MSIQTSTRIPNLLDLVAETYVSGDNTPQAFDLGASTGDDSGKHHAPGYWLSVAADNSIPE